MNLSPAGITAVNTYVAGMAGGWTGNADATILAAVNNPTIANPAAQGTVPAGYSVTSLLGLLSTGSLSSLRTFPALTQLSQDIASNNSGNVLVAVEALAAFGDITSAEATAVAGAVNATVADPSYEAHIGWAQANLGRALDLNDIEEARAAS
jgi:hypothetical protein